LKTSDGTLEVFLGQEPLVLRLEIKPVVHRVFKRPARLLEDVHGLV